MARLGLHINIHLPCTSCYQRKMENESGHVDLWLIWSVSQTLNLHS